MMTKEMKLGRFHLNELRKMFINKEINKSCYLAAIKCRELQLMREVRRNRDI